MEKNIRNEFKRRMNRDREEERGVWEWLKTFAGFISK